MSPDRSNRIWPFARGSGPTILLLTALFALAGPIWLAARSFVSGLLLVVVALLWLLVLYFFRDPDRPLPREKRLVASPADGRVVEVAREREEQFLSAEAIRISIFLAVTDVHVQRAPIEGRVALVEHRPGRFLQAFRPEASRVNESVAMLLETAFGRLLVKQIAGILARRCVNYAQAGEQLVAGQRFGLIRFGSRVDLFLPPAAEVLVRPGDRVQGALTPLARLPGQRNAAQAPNLPVPAHSAGAPDAE